MPNLKLIAQENDDFFESSDGKRSLKNALRRAKRHKAELLKKKNYFDTLSNEQFLALVNKQITIHGPHWIDRCYKKGKEPYAKRELDYIIKVIQEYGTPYVPKKIEMFATSYKSFKGLRLVRYDGQGTFFRIYRSKELLIQI